ncbi:homologous recombination OB-fold protein [Macadamia integrifolia]|uniref:homologous recombination OB-fold protein n=1 Tax=Macadamia integrifolia TaxID=60698 RepID=UPI001C52AB47|nr:homologous recombination OB-fold protein [Macadamia integrifolia]
MEPWEALDVDDSDLPSLLRPSTLLPCKRHLPLQQPSKPTTDIISSSCTLPLSLEPCSQLHRPSQSQTRIHNPETLDSQSDRCLPQIGTSEVEVEEEAEQQQQGPSTSSLRLLPGPAGALQAAMHQHSRYRDQNLVSSQERIPTQEFLRRAHEGGDGDEDFGTNSWLCALEFLGGGDGVALRSPLHSIKLRVGIEKVPQVVAVIKSCVPNGLGDLIVCLKYPMGTISASIHHKVLTESEFGRDIAVGAVMILKEVVVFSPSSSACYLNITLHNVVKIFSKECGPPPKQNYHVSRDRFAASGREQSGEIRPENIERTSYLRDRTADGITAGLVRRDIDDGTMEVDREMGGGGLAAGSFHFRSNSRESQHTAKEKEPLVRLDVAEKTREETVSIDGKHVPFGSFHSNSSGHLNAPKVVDTDMVKDPNDQEAVRMNGVKKLPIISSTTLPEWTDDQLEELFAAGSEDSDPLFS